MEWVVLIGIALVCLFAVPELFCGLACVVGLCFFIGWVFSPSPEQMAAKAKTEQTQRQIQQTRDAVRARLERGEVIFVNTAPDGTKLWMAKDALGEIVHFSTPNKQSPKSSSPEVASVPTKPAKPY